MSSSAKQTARDQYSDKLSIVVTQVIGEATQETKQGYVPDGRQRFISLYNGLRFWQQQMTSVTRWSVAGGSAHIQPICSPLCNLFTSLGPSGTTFHLERRKRARSAENSPHLHSRGRASQICQTRPCSGAAVPGRSSNEPTSHTPNNAKSMFTSPAASPFRKPKNHLACRKPANVTEATGRTSQNSHTSFSLQAQSFSGTNLCIPVRAYPLQSLLPSCFHARQVGGTRGTAARAGSVTSGSGSGPTRRTSYVT